jgi:CBS-domain-containing membrane protein
MKASDIMVAKVVTIGPNASVRDVANLLLNEHISAVPVVSEDGNLLGIVSEGDLMRRAEVGTERHRSWWLEMLSSDEALAAEFVKANARKAADVMTRDVITANPETQVCDIASLMEKSRVKRVPIVKDGKVVGIVSRANLLQALASAPLEADAQQKVDDSALREKVEARLSAQAWTKPWQLNVIVHDGIVDLWGVVHSQIEKTAARVAAERVPGVRPVNDNLVVWSAVVSRA